MAAAAAPNAPKAPNKAPITCHILDTSTGRPARGVRVKLSLASANSNHGPAADTATVFESQTDDDGRVKTWLPYSSSTSSGEVPVYTLDDVLGDIEGQTSRWTLRFDTEGYFGGADKTFFPEVCVVFTVRRGEAYHVPLLLSPFGYTTYRGS